MPDEIRQSLEFNASQAIAELTRLDRAFITVANTMQRFGDAVKGFNSNAVNQQLDSIGKSTERLSVSFGLLSRVVVTQAIVRGLSQVRDAFSSATQAAMAFEVKIAEIRSIDPAGSLGNLETIKGRLASLSAEYGVSLPEISKSTYETISAQIAKGEDVYRFLESAMILSKSGVTSLDNATSLLAGTMNSYGFTVEQAGEISSKFFRTVDLGQTTIGELSSAFGRVAPVAHELGVSFSEVNAAIAYVTIGGVKTNEAVTSIRAAMTSLLKPSEAMQRALQEIGFASGETAVAALGFKGTLDAVRQTTDGSASAMGALFPNVRALNSALRLSGAEGFAKYLKEIDNVSNDLAKSKAMEIMGTNAAIAAKEYNKLKTAIVTGFGDSVVKTYASIAQLTGGAEMLISVARTLTPVFQASALAVGAWGIMALATSTKLQSLIGSIPGWTRMIIGVGAAVAVGSWIGESIAKWADSSRAGMAKANEAMLSEFKSHQAKLLREQEEGDRKRVQSALAAISVQTRAYSSQLTALRSSNDTMVAIVSSSIDRIVKAREKAVGQLRHTVDSTEQIVKSSQDRITDLLMKREDRDFAKKIGQYEEPQQAVMMGRRAEELARNAAEAMAAAISPEQIDKAVRGFDRAVELAERAAQLADQTENRGAMYQTASALELVTNRQIEAEKALQSVTTSRRPALEHALALEEQRLAVLKQQALVIERNLSMFDKMGALSAKDLEIRKTEIDRALTGFPIQLKLEIGQSLARIRAQLDAAFSDYKRSLPVNVDLLEAATGKSVTTGYGITSGMTDVAKQADTLRKAVADYTTNQTRIDALKNEILQAQQGADSLGRGFLRSLSGSAGKPELLESFRANLDRTAASSKITDENIKDLLAQLEQIHNLSKAGIFGIGGQPGGQADVIGFAPTLKALQEIQKLQEKMSISPAADPAALRHLALMEHLLQQLPQSLTAIESAVTAGVEPSATIASNLWNGASAAAAIARNLSRASMPSMPSMESSDMESFDEEYATGGAVNYFAKGGRRGTDIVPAVLSPGEFVMSAKSTRQWYSQLVAMNAGAQPAYRSQGGSTTNVGDIAINVTASGEPEQNARAIMRILRREVRRGTSRPI